MLALSPAGVMLWPIIPALQTTALSVYFLVLSAYVLTAGDTSTTEVIGGRNITVTINQVGAYFVAL
jgi:hypothetical protein